MKRQPNELAAKGEEWLCGFTHLSDKEVSNLVEDLCAEIRRLQQELAQTQEHLLSYRGRY